MKLKILIDPKIIQATRTNFMVIIIDNWPYQLFWLVFWQSDCWTLFFYFFLDSLPVEASATLYFGFCFFSARFSIFFLAFFSILITASIFLTSSFQAFLAKAFVFFISFSSLFFLLFLVWQPLFWPTLLASLFFSL